MRVVYWNNIPSPYFVERMSALASVPDLDVHAVFNQERNTDRSWAVDPEAWQFTGHWAHRGRLGLYDAAPIAAKLRPDLLVSLYGEPSFALNAPRAARHSGRWAIRVVPTYDAWETRTRLKEAAKRALGHMVDGAKVPGSDGRVYAESLGIPASRVHEVQQSVPVDHFASAERSSARLRLGIGDDEFVFIYVGRLWEGKGLGLLLAAMTSMSTPTPWSILVVGDGPMAEEIEKRTDLPIRSTGFVQRDALPAYLAASDCLLFPTLGDPFGLVVEEAMAAGIPVITSDQMGDARDRVERVGAGIVVAAPEPAAWVEAMTSMMAGPIRRRFAQGARDRAAKVGHEAYVATFMAFANAVLEAPPRVSLPRLTARRRE